MNFKRPTHILAAIAIAVGCWWSFMVLLQPLKRIWTEGFSDALPWFGLFIIPMMIIPGAMALFSGIGLLKEVTKEGIKGSVGALSIFGVFWSAVYVEKFLLPENSNMLSLLIALAIVIPLYVYISKRLYNSEQLEVSGRDEFIGKGILTLVAWMIWLSLSEFVREYAPVKEGYTHIKEEPWDTLGFIAPIIIAWAFYKIASKALTKQKVDQDDIVNSEAAPLRD
jgi:hypothetical protein